MKLPRSITGEELARHICRHWDYTRLRQLRTETPFRDLVVIPAHKPLRPGTFARIVSDIADHKQVTREDILRHL